MAIATKPDYGKLDDFYLDPRNPRLGRSDTEAPLKQDAILKLMEDWKLDELAVSFMESGHFWVQEALLVIEEPIEGKTRKVVLEGNRRVAALRCLRDAFEGKPANRKWRDIVEGVKAPPKLFEEIPYLRVDQRSDIEAFLGFRHVTGIEEWRPAEKAAYIAQLVDQGKMNYETVMRKIGSKTPAVRQNYIAHKLLVHIEKTADIPKNNFEDRFSVMYLSLRTEGVQKYLQIDISAEPGEVKREIPRIHQKALANFALWIFGDKDRSPLFGDSRNVDVFGQVLQSKEARDYLERPGSPSFDVARRLAGGGQRGTGFDSRPPLSELKGIEKSHGSLCRRCKAIDGYFSRGQEEIF
jgi:hypothetical protein